MIGCMIQGGSLDGTCVQHGLTCSPSKEKFFDANLVNSVKLPTGNAVDNTEPSREKSRKV